MTKHRSDFQLAEGKNDHPLLVGGHFLALTQQPQAKWNVLWLLTEILDEWQTTTSAGRVGDQ
ncbi:hypothetical protein PS906_05216 [Pseudomonas fluorescens]|nr:hypothetical protein PS906_05216 [Pseudomonas fluorescens]